MACAGSPPSHAGRLVTSCTACGREESSMQQEKEERMEDWVVARPLISSRMQGGRLVSPSCSVAFVYGTLKQGFGNHWLMEEQMASGHARFLGAAFTKEQFPLVCGPFQVPFLLNIPAKGRRVRGEVYEVDSVALRKLDELEGIGKGHYVRSPIIVSDLQLDGGVSRVLSSPVFEAQVYFADPHYAPGMAHVPHLDAYTHKEAATYVRRKDRPQNKTFLEHVWAWIENVEKGGTQPKYAAPVAC